MKSVIVLACVLAVAAAQFSNGQYVPEQNKYNSYNNRYNNYNNRFNKYNNQFNKYQSQYKPFASSTSFPSYFSSTPAPSRATFAPFKFFSSTPAPSVIVAASAAPSASPAPSVAPSAAPSAAPSPVPSLAPLKPVYATLAPAPAALVSKYYSEGPVADIISYESEVNPDGAFKYAFQTSNGIAAQEEGAPRSFYSGKDEVAPVVAQGSFAWTSPEGQVVQISYVADENGYQPSGDAIPQAPAIPELIARSLEYIARNAPLSAAKLSPQ